MWAMEYNPNLFTFYEESMDAASSGNQGEQKVSYKMLKQYGKFERKNVQTGWTDQRGALAVFLVASVLEKKNKRLLKEAQGMDDVVQVRQIRLSRPTRYLATKRYMLLYLETSNVDLGRNNWKFGRQKSTKRSTESS